MPKKSGGDGFATVHIQLPLPSRSRGVGVKDGIAALSLPHSLKALPFWDTPVHSPVATAACFLLSEEFGKSSRLFLTQLLLYNAVFTRSLCVCFGVLHYFHSIP